MFVSAHEAPTVGSAMSSLSLQQARDQVWALRWARCRAGGATLASHCKMAIEGLAEVQDSGVEVLTVGEITPQIIQKAVIKWGMDGLSASTIIARLNCLSAFGLNVRGLRPQKDRKLKWWLRPDQEQKAIAWLRERASTQRQHALACHSLAFLIRWTTQTGLRIEETLRLTIADISADHTEITVPGLKTQMAQATLPLGGNVRQMLESWLMVSKAKRGTRLIPVSYRVLWSRWSELREAMGWPDNATMKALRRTAARSLHADRGMPLDMIRQYLRHENVTTTMMYLHLTGGYGTDEMRRYLG